MRGTTTPVVLWIITPEEAEEDHDYNGDGGEGSKQFKRVRICGPITTTDPRPEGWYPKAQGPKGDIVKLQSFTIKNITALLTKKHATARPNCEAAWDTRLMASTSKPHGTSSGPR